MRSTRILAAAALVVLSIALSACAPETEESIDRARYQELLEIEEIDGVIAANRDGILLDITATPHEITETAVAVLALLDEQESDIPHPSFVLYHPGVGYSDTILEFASLESAHDHFEERVQLWAELVTRGFTEVRMQFFTAGSEYGTGILSVHGWLGEGAEPSAGETYLGIRDSLESAALTNTELKVSVILGTKVLSDDASAPVGDNVLAVTESVATQAGVTGAAARLEATRTTVELAGRLDDAGASIPFTEAEVAAILAPFESAGLLTDALVITRPLSGNTSETLWGAGA